MKRTYTAGTPGQGTCSLDVVIKDVFTDIRPDETSSVDALLFNDGIRLLVTMGFIAGMRFVQNCGNLKEVQDYIDMGILPAIIKRVEDDKN